MFLPSFVWGALLGLALPLPRVANAQSSSDWKLSDAPAPDLYLRRALARVAVLGNYAYIDGGEVSQLDANGVPITARTSNAVNSTLSIDLSKSWSASNVTIRQIVKSAPVMDGQAMWKNEGMETFFIWGGHKPFGGKIDSPQTWKFEADGQGGGEWVTDTPANPTLYGELRRNEEGAFATTPDAGFWFGGIASGWTNSNPASQPVPGILSYNMTTKQWANETQPGVHTFSEHGTIVGGGAVYIPTFGSNGLILVMGGATYTLEPSQTSPAGWMDFSNLTFYDPITKEWVWQQTTGNAPTARRGFCYVGAEGTNGTYEIFVFGGTNTDTGSSFDDVFVLSLPGFVWTQVPYEANIPRRFHTCAVVGRRQMLSVGGTDGKSAWSGADPWPQGLGLFDMTDWTWKNNYDADAKDYETAKTIQDWYQDGGTNNVRWSSNEVQAIFRKSTTAEEPKESPKDENNNGKKNSVTLPVVVGVVVGAVVGGLLAFAAFWFLRRRKQQAAAAAASTAKDEEPAVRPHYEPLPPSELHAQVPQPELWGGPIPKQELWAPVTKPEMAGTTPIHFTVTELDAQQQQQDLPRR